MEMMNIMIPMQMEMMTIRKFPSITFIFPT
jgi:hypothetical protein